MADQIPHPVVVTRPRAQADAFAQRVAATGREAIVFPLLDIQPLPDSGALQAALADLTQYAMVAFVSPNAIDAAFSNLPQPWPSRVTIGVMGEGSRAALAQYGVHADNATIVSPRDRLRTDSQTLLEALDLTALHGKQVLIVRGESGRELLADALRAHGVLVTQVAAYRRCAPVLDAPTRSTLASLLRRDADWVITSSEALHILMQMVRQVDGDPGAVRMQQQSLIVPHVRIAETAHALGFLNVVLTASGDEHLFAALQSRP
jgi:uroporphyrinogen-III synthase